jgi:AraC-like DNA-binding protein
LARLVAQEVRTVGIDLGPLVQASGLTADQIDSDERMGSAEQTAFVQVSARALGRDHLGFELAKDFDLRNMGLLYYVAASSESLGEAIERVERFSAVGNEALVIRAGRREDLSIRLEYSGVSRHSDRHQIEFFVAALVRLCRALSRLPLVPVQVSFCHDRSDGTKAYDEFFGCQTQFLAAQDSIVFEPRCRRLSVVSADPHLSEILIKFCEETLTSRRKVNLSFRVMVENAIAPLLPHGKPEFSEIAQKLHLSPRTLARRLAAEGTTFARVLDEMRRELATRYLEDGKLSISQVAWLIGFQEVAAFTHAFRRWTGKTPSMVRRVGDSHS